MNKIVLTAVMSALMGLAFGAGLTMFLFDGETDSLDGGNGFIDTSEIRSNSASPDSASSSPDYSEREFEAFVKKEESKSPIRRHSVTKASQEAIREAIAKIPAPLPKRRAGNITGIVLDEAGKPMRDIELSVKRSDYEAPPNADNAEENVRNFLQRVRWEESSRQRQTTDREGRFQFSGVGEGKYIVEIMTDGLRIVHSDRNYIRNLEAGSEVELTLREQALLEVAVKLPSGEMAERADLITVDVAGNQRTRRWHAADRIMEFDPGFMRIGARIRGEENFGSRELKEIDLVPGSEPARLLIKVEKEPTLQGKVVFQKGFPQRSIDIYYMKLDGGTPTHEELRSEGSRIVSEGESFNTPVAEAGRYAVASISRTEGLNSDVVIASVGSESKDVVLRLNGLKRSDYLEVDIRGPAGQPVLRPRMWTSMRYEKDGRERTRRGQGGMIRRTDGKCWVAHPVLEDGEGTVVESFVRVDCEFGSKKVPYRMGGMASVRVEFDDMGTLELSVTGYPSRELLAQLDLDLRNEEGYRVGGNVGNQRNRRNADPLDVAEVAMRDGVWFFAGLQPGDYSLKVRLGGRSNSRLLSDTEFKITSGPNRETVDLPNLYDVAVHLKNGKARNASLQQRNAPRGSSIPSARFDDRDIALFSNLLAGEYTITVRANGANRIKTFQLPGTSKVEIDATAGRTAVVTRCNKGSRAWNAGIRNGDVIIKLNGRDMKTSRETNRVRSGPRGKETFSVTIERNGTQRVIVIDRDMYREKGRPFRIRAN